MFEGCPLADHRKDRHSSPARTRTRCRPCWLREGGLLPRLHPRSGYRSRAGPRSRVAAMEMATAMETAMAMLMVTVLATAMAVAVESPTVSATGEEQPTHRGVTAWS